MVNILSVPERINLFKEINKVHKKIYGWKLLYWNAWGKVYYIDIDRDARATSNDWVPMSTDEIKDYYFLDHLDRDITSLYGLFAWETYYFYHFNPYKFDDYYHPSRTEAFESRKYTEDDFITDNSGKRVRPDIDHPVRCLQSLIEVQQRKDDGKLWISTNWLYRPECYGSASYIVEELLPAMTKIAKGDEGHANRIREKYWEIRELNEGEFMMQLERYFRGDRLKGRYWEGGYAFAASREWKIKNNEQLNEALKVEDKHFQRVLEQYIRWLRNKVIKLPEENEITLKKIISEHYYSFPRSQAIDMCKQLMEEDKTNPSDVYLWWGGEPNRDANYALLTFYFEIDPKDIGTSIFDEKVSRNLRAIFNIAETSTWFYDYRDYEPNVWRAIFS